MTFPTINEVEKADRYTLCSWYRFLPSAMTEEDRAIQNRIYDRWNEVGGFTPEISKALGWGNG